MRRQTNSKTCISQDSWCGFTRALHAPINSVNSALINPSLLLLQAMPFTVCNPVWDTLAICDLMSITSYRWPCDIIFNFYLGRGDGLGYKVTITIHCTENSKQIFPEMKLCDLVPNLYIHVSVRHLYIPTIGPAILLQENRWTDIWIAHRYMNVEIFGRAISFSGNI